MNELYNQLKQAYPDYSHVQIVELIGKLASQATALKARLAANGYPQSYIEGLSMPDLFNLGQSGALPLATGQNELNREAQGMRDLEAAYGTRAGAGAQLAVLLQQREEAKKAAETDPWRMAEDMANRANLPAGSGSPYQALLGAGTYIDPKPYEEDPRLTSLIDRLDKYVRMEPPAEDPQIAAVRAAYARDSAAAARYFGASEDARKALARAGGGDVTLREPVVGIGANSGRVLFTAAENGPEDMRHGMGMMRFKPRKGVSRKMKPGRQKHIIDQAMEHVPAAAAGRRFLNIGGAGGDVMKAAAKYRENTAKAAKQNKGIADRLRAALASGDVQYDTDGGGFVVDGVRYSKGTTPEQYERMAKGQRRAADALTYSPAGRKQGFSEGYEGGQMTADERAEVEARLRRRGGPQRPDTMGKASTSAYSVEKGTGGSGGIARVPVELDARQRSADVLDTLLGPVSSSRGVRRGMGGTVRGSTTNRYARYAVPNRAAGGKIKLRSGAAIALGNSLRNNPFAHPDMIARLLAGEAPLPGQVTDRFRKNVLDRDEVMRGAFDSMIKSFGVKSPASYMAEAKTFDPRGIGVVTVRR